jgi:hypothetical protein
MSNNTTKSKVVKTETTVSKKETPKVLQVEKIYKSFRRNLDGVNLYFKKFGTLAVGEDETIKDNSKQFFKEINAQLIADRKRREKIKKDGNLDKITHDEISDALLDEITRKLSKQPKISPKNFEILSRGSFLMLNNYFEYLLADLLTFYYNKFQNSLNAKEFKVSLQELNEYETVEEITKHLILKEVESLIIEKTFDQLLEHFEKSLTISLNRELINWQKIIEIRERRHLVVHNSSIVNKKYLSRTNNPYNLKIGDTVDIDNDYFKESFRELKLAGELLIFNCWGKWDVETTDDAIWEILMTAFENLLENDYDSVLKICAYGNQITPKNPNQEDLILRLKFNRCIALKKQNNKSELDKHLKDIPVGTASPIFKIVYQILNDDHRDLVENFKKAIIVDNFIIDHYIEWPIFDFVRENEELNKKLLETFK